MSLIIPLLPTSQKQLQINLMEPDAEIFESIVGGLSILKHSLES